jgi:hypothetical protein
MSHRKHRRQSTKRFTRHCFEPQPTVDYQIPKKRPLGALRRNKKTKPRSPDATGKFYFQRHTLKEIYRQLMDGDDEVICNVACWRNSDGDGAYLTVEISPQLISFERRRPNGDAFYELFEEEDE